MSIKKGRFYLTFKSSLIAFFLIKFFVNYSQPFCNLTATLQRRYLSLCKTFFFLMRGMPKTVGALMQEHEVGLAAIVYVVSLQ